MDSSDILRYYATGFEKTRLTDNYFKLEGVRTRSIIERYLNNKSLTIVDIGGATGFYSFWLHKRGHQVSLVDLSSENIRIANEIQEVEKSKLKSCKEGNALNLEFDSNQFDMALLMGPLYHLTDRHDRVAALKEATRVLKPGGILISAVISRYGSLVDGMKHNLFEDDAFEKIMFGGLRTGVHTNHTGKPEYFTTAYFHLPNELQKEIEDAGLRFEKLIAVEGVGWLANSDAVFSEKTNRIISAVESDPNLISLSPHIIGVAYKKGD